MPLQQQMTPLGEFSPPALMWAFMSYSYSYRAFAGLAEVLGGTLLLWRRTTTLGALIVLAAMSNVLAMNWSYDVSVKLWAAHLVAMSAVLLAPESARLVRFFVLNRDSPAAALPPLLSNPRHDRWLSGGAAAYAAYAIATILWNDISLGVRAHGGQPASVAGLYDVESLARNGVSIVGSTDQTRWRRVAIESTGFMTVQ